MVVVGWGKMEVVEVEVAIGVVPERSLWAECPPYRQAIDSGRPFDMPQVNSFDSLEWTRMVMHKARHNWHKTFLFLM